MAKWLSNNWILVFCGAMYLMYKLFALLAMLLDKQPCG